MFIPYPWPKSSHSHLEAWENPSIPAGYTYLAQFLAHDTVHSSVPTSGLTYSRAVVRNHRSVPLELQTLYGSGFDGFLTAMTEADCRSLKPSKLPLARMRIGETNDERCPFRDIPRAPGPRRAGRGPLLTNVLLADDRNDNSALISQITVLFTMFHDLMVDLLHEEREDSGRPTVGLRYFAELFLDAKEICVDVYRRIIQKDLLATLLQPAVYSRYFAASPSFLDQQSGTNITLEYAQALRFGHSMVRPHYRTNDFHNRREELIDVLLTTSRARPWRLPLDETWAVQWSKFFAIGGQPTNFSRRTGPHFSVDLVSRLAFDSIDETDVSGLAYRDLLNAASMPGWSVPSLIAEISRSGDHRVRSSRLLSDEGCRQDARLSDGQEASGLSNEDIEIIGRDPPLALFVLFEAASEMGGERLGVLGSILVGEPIAKVLQAAAAPTCAGFAGKTQTAAARIASMSELVAFVHSRSKPDVTSAIGSGDRWTGRDVLV
jgi:hypothetical protein